MQVHRMAPLQEIAQTKVHTDVLHYAAHTFPTLDEYNRGRACSIWQGHRNSSNVIVHRAASKEGAKLEAQIERSCTIPCRAELDRGKHSGLMTSLHLYGDPNPFFKDGMFLDLTGNYCGGSSSSLAGPDCQTVTEFFWVSSC